MIVFAVLGLLVVGVIVVPPVVLVYRARQGRRAGYAVDFWTVDARPLAEQPRL